jgi:ElaB/YqjD/DUF883 family membrane-anchored ribosome-binding protein
MSEKILLNKIKKHLQGHITEGNFDNLDIAQLKLIDKELKRIMPAKKKGGAVRDRPDGYYDSQNFLKDSGQDKQFMIANPNQRGQYRHIVNNHVVKDGTGVKGSKSKTHKGDLDYTTKKGDKVFHENGHFVKKSYKPFDAHKGSVSKTHAGLDYQHYDHHLKVPIRGGGYLRINICHGGGSDTDSDSDMEGEGLWDDAKDAFKRAGNKIKDTATNVYNTAKDIAHKVYTGDTGMPPNVKKILDQYGNEIIRDIEIVRNPVGKALTGALSIASLGEFGKNLENAPYDKLFHLKIVITLQSGVRVSLEKVERVSMTVNPKPVKDEESTPTPLNGKSITLNQLYENAHNAMGSKFYPYSARDNNCQNFILNVLQASGVGNGRDYEFVKQDTKSLFGDNSFLRKASNTITDIGARFNVLQQGGGVDDEYLDSAIALMTKHKRSKKGLVATNTIPITGGKLPKHQRLTFKDFAQGWARHHGITHGGALKSKQAKHHYKTINDHLIKEGKGWDDFIQGSQKFFTGGYNDQINQGIQNVGNQVKDAFDAFGNKISGTANQITQQIRDQANKVISDVNNGIKVGKDAIMKLANSAEVTANQKWDLLKAFVKDASNKVSEGVMTGVNFVKKYGETAINWLKDNKDAMKAIAISVAKFAVKKGIPLVGEQLGGILADALAAGMLQPELIPVAQTLGSMAGKKLGEMLSDYIMSLGLADAQGNPDADKWLAITGQAIDAAKMAYAGYQGAQSVGNYLSGASNAGSAASKVATAGTGVKMTPAKMKKLLKERVESYNLMTVKRSRGRPSKSY